MFVSLRHVMRRTTSNYLGNYLAQTIAGAATGYITALYILRIGQTAGGGEGDSSGTPKLKSLWDNLYELLAIIYSYGDVT